MRLGSPSSAWRATGRAMTARRFGLLRGRWVSHCPCGTYSHSLCRRIRTDYPDRPDALFVARNSANYANRQLIADFAGERRMPGMYPVREFVEAGGLMSYGVNVADLFRRAAGYVDKVLKGAMPADLPVEHPTKFELVINLKTAKALGLTVPATLLARADEVIE